MNEIYRHLAPWLLTITEAIMVLAAVWLSLRTRRRAGGSSNELRVSLGDWRADVLWRFGLSRHWPSRFERF